MRKTTFLQQYESMFPPPVEYELASYDVTSSPIANTEKSGYELRPLTWDDQARHARQDVEDWMKKHAKNTTQLGPQMSDEEFSAHYGAATAKRMGRYSVSSRHLWKSG